MVYGTQLTNLFLMFINQRSHHWGASHCTIHHIIHYTMCYLFTMCNSAPFVLYNIYIYIKIDLNINVLVLVLIYIYICEYWYSIYICVLVYIYIYIYVTIVHYMSNTMHHSLPFTFTTFIYIYIYSNIYIIVGIFHEINHPASLGYQHFRKPTCV